VAHGKDLILCTMMLCGLFCAGCSVSPLHGDAPGGTGGLVRWDFSSAGAGHLKSAEEPKEDSLQEPLRLPKSLGLKDAFLYALRANKDILVASLAAEADEQRIGAAKGEFDPTVFVEFSRGRTSAPVLGPPLARSEEAEGAFSAGIRQRVWTGTAWELGFVSDYVRDLNATGALNPSYGSEVRLSVEQDLLKDAGSDINRTAILVARNNWRISQERFRSEIIETLFQVEVAYWDLYLALADLKVREEQLERAKKLVARAEAQVNVGLSPRLDIVRAKSSAAAQEVGISRARNEIKRLRHRLLRLLGIMDVGAADAEFELADAPPSELFHTDLAEAVEIAQKARPDYAEAKLAIQTSELQLRFLKNQKLPRLQLFGEYSLTALDDEFGDSLDGVEEGDYSSWLVGLRFEVPLPDRTSYFQYTAAQLEHRKAKAQLEALTERITREVADALADLRAAEERIAVAQQARQLAEDLLRAEEKSYSLGRSNSLDVLDAQQALAAAERDEVSARTDYARALANLFRVQGISAQKQGIVFADHRAP